MMQKTELKSLDLAVEVRLLLTVVTKLTMRDLEQRITEAMPGTSLLQFGVMRMLSRDPLTLSEISTKMMLTPSTLVPAVDKLEREGLVVRGKDPNDRRRTPLMLTDKAHALLDAVPPGHPDDAIVKAVAQMGGVKAAQMRNLLHELVGLMSPDRDLFEDMLTNHPDRCAPRMSSK